jgi:hypothetical protein
VIDVEIAEGQGNRLCDLGKEVVEMVKWPYFGKLGSNLLVTEMASIQMGWRSVGMGYFPSFEFAAGEEIQ